ncbi:MAG: Rrf2 family transcriptional regulator [Ferruginibacter sp.]
MLSKKTQYGLKALGYLASRYGEGPVLIADISHEKNIPIKFLENILLHLKKHGVLESKEKGVAITYQKPPAKTTIAAAIRMLEGPIALLPCVSLNFYRKCDDCNESSCGLNKVMAATRDATLKVLDKKTLRDLADQ